MALLSGCPRVDHLDRAPTPEDLHRVYIRTVEDTDTVFDTLLSILRQPALGQYVRHVKLDRAVGYPLQPPDLKTTREISEEDRKLLEGAIRQAGFQGKQYDMMMNIVTHRPRESSFLDTKRKIDLIHLTQALTALMISVAPKLESFAFPVISRGFDSPEECYLMLQAFLERANANPAEIPYLQNLRDVSCLSNKDPILSDKRFYENYDFAEQMKLVGNLPAVETIRVDAIEDRHESIELEPRSTNFKKVYIQNSNYSSRSLAEIITSCKRLQEFKYSIGGRASVDGSHAMFIEQHLLDALLYHTNTLQTLEVDVDEEFFAERPAYWDTEDEYSVKDPYGDASNEGRPMSLRDFTAMTHLRIGIKLLMALARASMSKGGLEEPSFSLIDILPPNLEYLCILGYTVGTNSQHDAQISFLMEHRDRLPLLKEIAGVDVHIPNATSVEDPDED